MLRLVLTGIMLLAGPHASSSPPLYRTLQNIERDQDLGDDRVSALVGAYYAELPETVRKLDCGAVETNTLDDLFVAAHLIAFHAPRAEFVDQLSCLYGAIEAGGATTNVHQRRLYGVLVKSRRFDEANRMRARYGLQVPELPRLNEVQGNGPHVMALAGENDVALVPWEASARWAVIAVVHPRCSPSKRALENIMRDPDLGWFRQRLTLLMPAGPAWLQDEMRKWNALHPSHPMAAEIPSHGIQGVRTDETPLFFLMKEGNVVDMLQGWPDDATKISVWRERMTGSAKDPCAPAEGCR